MRRRKGRDGSRADKEGTRDLARGCKRGERVLAPGTN
jgi:hypothetical protein